MAIFKFNLVLRTSLLAHILVQKDLNYCSRHLKVNRSTIFREITNNSEYRVSKKICEKCQRKEKCPTFNKSWKFKKYCFTSDVLKDECQYWCDKPCKHWSKFPYCCNNCLDMWTCTRLKRYYDPNVADNFSKRKSKSTRSKIFCTTTQMHILNAILLNGTNKGQSIRHIYEANKGILSFISEQTIRRYIKWKLLWVKQYQLPKAVRYKPRRGSNIDKQNIASDERKDGRSYFDFLKLDCVPKRQYWEYDSVEGIKADSKAILTITYVEFDFQFGFIIDKHNPNSVLNVIRKLQKLFGDEYWKMFKINLCDNGTEFDKFNDIEWDDETGEKKISVYYTRVYRSTDKAHCERNHEYIRMILPKRELIEFMTQDKVNLMFSHINSYTRKMFKNKTPYGLFVERFGTGLVNLLGLVYIDPNDVTLKPFLVK